MSASVLIVGLPPAAGCAREKTWRAAAEFVHARLRQRFGDSVRFEYAELFTSDLRAHPEVEDWVASGDVTPPIVVIDGVRRFAGGKLMVSAIERAVAESLSVAADARVEEPVS